MIKLSAVLLVTVLLSGCVQSGDFASSIPLLNDFLKQHPNADVRVSFVSKSGIEGMLTELRNECGNPFLEAGDYYAIVINDSASGLSVRAWVDLGNKTLVCAIKEGTKVAANGTEIVNQTEGKIPTIGEDSSANQSEQENQGSMTSAITEDNTRETERNTNAEPLTVKITAPESLSTITAESAAVKAETNRPAICDMSYYTDLGYIKGYHPVSGMDSSTSSSDTTNAIIGGHGSAKTSHEATINSSGKGSYEVTIKCSDAVSSGSATIKFYIVPPVDYAAPVISVLSPAAGATIKDDYTSVSVSTDEDARCTYYVIYSSYMSSTIRSLDVDYGKVHTDSIKNDGDKSTDTLKITCKDRHDNSATASVSFSVDKTVQVAKPDLTVSGISVSPTQGTQSISGDYYYLILSNDAMFNVTINVANKGNVSVAATKVRATFSDASAPQEFSCDPIDAGQTVACGTFEHLFVIPSTVTLEVDPDGVVNETNEGNNKFTIGVSKKVVYSVT